MKVHVCASYKRSPVGFRPGSFYYREDRVENYLLSFDSGNSIIYNIIEQGFITRAEGKMPNQEKYLLLIKAVEYHYKNHDEFGKIVYINIAFEFDTAKDYNRFKSGYDNFGKSELAKSMADFIVPDKNEMKFGLHIDGMKFNCFVEEIKSKAIEMPDTVDSFELVTRSSSTTDYADKIKELFGVEFGRKNETRYIYPKKKHSLINQNHQMEMFYHSSAKASTAKFKPFHYIIIGGVVIIFIGFAIWIFGRNKTSTENVDQSYSSSDHTAISWRPLNYSINVKN